MPELIFRKSERDLKERAAESRETKKFAGVEHYARDVEEADNLYRSWGRDNPDNKPVLVDDDGKAEKTMRDKQLRNAGYDPERYD